MEWSHLTNPGPPPPGIVGTADMGWLLYENPTPWYGVYQVNDLQMSLALPPPLASELPGVFVLADTIGTGRQFALKCRRYINGSLVVPQRVSISGSLIGARAVWTRLDRLMSLRRNPGRIRVCLHVPWETHVHGHGGDTKQPQYPRSMLVCAYLRLLGGRLYANCVAMRKHKHRSENRTE